MLPGARDTVPGGAIQGDDEPTLWISVANKHGPDRGERQLERGYYPDIPGTAKGDGKTSLLVERLPVKEELGEFSGILYRLLCLGRIAVQVAGGCSNRGRQGGALSRRG